jgi:acyl-CoA dehydrogenase
MSPRRDIRVEIALEPHHYALRAELARLGRDVIAPIAQWEEERPDEAYRMLRQALAHQGVLAEMVPAAYGGRRDDLDLRAICIAREVLAAYSGLADLIFVMQGLGSYPLAQAGSLALRHEWLPKVARGEAIAALALTEEHAGSDVAALKTTARDDGDCWVLDGEKWFVSNAGYADFYTLFATTDPAAGRAGLCCFFVEADRTGVSVTQHMELLAPHPLGIVHLSGCKVPKTNQLGDLGSGFALAMSTLDMFRTSVGAAAVGMAARAFDEAVAFAKNREQFGQPLAEFQLTQAAIADMAVDLEAARLLVYRAATARDHGARRVTLEASMAKLHSTEAAQRVVDRAVQLHGGRGVLRGSVVERLYREIRPLRIYEGTSEIQRLVIAAQLLRD